MPSINLVIESDISRSVRCRQLEAMFDVPPEEKQRLEWVGELPIENESWNVGLIVGPSGCGKSSIAKEVFAENYHPEFNWNEKSVVDDFSKEYSIEDIAKVCSAVGFNTVPAWMRPYSVLSTGEKFRVDIARRLLEAGDLVVVDEFTSVVDRQVAKIGAYAVQKFIRKKKKRFVGISCHYDIIEWLSPDWVFEPATMEYRPRGCLQRRPNIEIEIKRIPHRLWKFFAPFHYLTKELHKGAQCFGLFADGALTTFIGILHNPNRIAIDLKRITRIVTLPDWQGLGLGPVLATQIGAAYKAMGYRLRAYPAHPSLIRTADRSKEWALKRKPVIYQKTKPGVHAVFNPAKAARYCAVFEYCGPAMDKETAEKLIQG